MKIKEWGWTTYKRPSHASEGVVRKKQKCRDATNCTNNHLTSPNEVNLRATAPDNGEAVHIDLLDSQTTLNSVHSLLGQDLHAAVRERSFSKVAILLSVDNVKDEIDTKNSEGNTCLHVAVQMQLSQIAELLIQNGADANSKGAAGRTALHHVLDCYESWERRFISRLLELCSVLSEPDDAGDTPLHIALRRGLETYSLRSSPVGELLDQGVKVNQANRAGVTPFQMVIEKMSDEHWSKDDKWDTLERFLGHNADPNLSINGRNVLAKVFEDVHETYNACHIMEFLLWFGSSSTCTDSRGDFLVYAVYRRLKAAKADTEQRLESIAWNWVLTAMLASSKFDSRALRPWWWRQYQNLRHSYYENTGSIQYLLSGIQNLMTGASLMDEDRTELVQLALGYAVNHWLEADWKSRRRCIDLMRKPAELKNELLFVAKRRRDVVQVCRSHEIKVEWNDYGLFKLALDLLSETSELPYESSLALDSELGNLQSFLELSNAS